MTAIVNAHGEHILTINGNPETIALNTPNGCRAVEDPPRMPMRYNGVTWEDLPPAPGHGYSFNYAAGVWVDTRNINDVRESQWNKIKLQRDELEFGGFEYKGNIYDSDQVSQGRIMGAAVAGVDQTWTLANNTTVDLTGDELKELYAALQRHVATAHERGRLARYKIDVAMTPQDIEAVTL